MPSISRSGGCWRNSPRRFMAGLPVIVKPATTTAHLAELAVRQIVESGLLPDGDDPLQSRSSLGDLLDRLDRAGQHRVHRIGQHPQAKLRGCADSGRLARYPVQRRSRLAQRVDPRPGRGAGHHRVRVVRQVEVMREVTGKTGQKCAAIRRTLVPAGGLVGDVVEALAGQARQGQVAGDPRVAGTTMGPLVSRGQRDEVAFCRQASHEERRRCHRRPGLPERSPSRPAASTTVRSSRGRPCWSLRTQTHE